MPSLTNPQRLAAIRDLHLTEGTPDEVFDGATRLASRLIGAPVALVSIVTEDRQVFVSQIGLREPWATRGQTPLSHSFCQHVVATGRPLQVRDARESDLLKDNLAIPDLGVVAYYGVPLHSPDGDVLGSFCAIDGVPRDWTDGDLEALSDLARLIERVLVARSASARLLGALEERENLMATIVHDVRQPLSGARLGADLFQRNMDRLDESTRSDVLDAMVRQLGRADDLLEQLVRPSHAGVPEAVDVAAVVTEVGLLTTRTGQRPIDVDVAPGTTWWGRALDLQRIVANLVRNALLHGGPGVTVRVEAGRTDAGIQVRVIDDGAGIDSVDHERIFELRRQGQGTAGGSGLGLHIVRMLARESGGDARVESTVGEGATFVVDLHDADDGADAADAVGGATAPGARETTRA